MIFKIKKCTKSYWWYFTEVGKNIDIDLNDCKFENDCNGTFIWFKYGNFFNSKCGILLDDIDYIKTIRKQKMNKICLI